MMHSPDHLRTTVSRPSAAPSSADIASEELYARFAREVQEQPGENLDALRARRQALLEESLAQEVLLARLGQAVPGAAGGVLLAEAAVGKSTDGEQLSKPERTARGWFGALRVVLDLAGVRMAGTVPLLFGMPLDRLPQDGTKMLRATAEFASHESTIVTAAARTGLKESTRELTMDDPLDDARVARLVAQGADAEELRYWQYVYPSMLATKQRDLRTALVQLEEALSRGNR